MTSREMRQRRARLIESARAIVDQVPDGQTLSAQAAHHFDQFMADADRLMIDINRSEHLERVAHNRKRFYEFSADRRGMSADQVQELHQAETLAFDAFLRGGMASLTEEQTTLMRVENSMGTESGPGGGYTVPEKMFGFIVDAQLAYGGMITTWRVHRHTTMSGAPISMPTADDTENEGTILQENTQVQSDDVKFGRLTLNAYTYTSKLVLVPNTLLQDSAFDLIAYLGGKMGIRIARAVNRHLTTGDGASKPMGVVNAATLLSR